MEWILRFFMVFFCLVICTTLTCVRLNAKTLQHGVNLQWRCVNNDRIVFLRYIFSVFGPKNYVFKHLENIQTFGKTIFLPPDTHIYVSVIYCMIIVSISYFIKCNFIFSYLYSHYAHHLSSLLRFTI